QVPATSIRQMVDHYNPYTAPRFELEDLDPKTGSEQRNLVQLNTARVQALAAYLQAGSAEEGRAVWDNYLASRDNYGYSQIVEYRNNKIAENLDRLGDGYSISE